MGHYAISSIIVFFYSDLWGSEWTDVLPKKRGPRKNGEKSESEKNPAKLPSDP